MRLIFMGTPDFAVPSLEALAASRHEVALVVTQPDRPGGRGRRLRAPAVKLLAERLGLKVAQPERVSSREGVELLRAAGPEAGVVCAFGELLSQEVLSLAPLGFFNVHPSLLPGLRGPAPVVHTILSGDQTTGVSVIRLSGKMDAGDIVNVSRTAVAPAESAGELAGRLAALGAGALLEALDRVESGSAVFEPQDESGATYAPRVTKEDAKIDWARSACFLERFVRAMSPEPGAHTSFTRRGRSVRLTVLSARTAEGQGPAGTVILAEGGRLVVAAGHPHEDAPRALELAVVQPEGKRAMSAREFLMGYAISCADRMG